MSAVPRALQVRYLRNYIPQNDAQLLGHAYIFKKYARFGRWVFNENARRIFFLEYKREIITGEGGKGLISPVLHSNFLLSTFPTQDIPWAGREMYGTGSAFGVFIHRWCEQKQAS